MNYPFDDLFGEGATDALMQAGTVDGEVPSTTQMLLDENRVLITLIWPSATQQVVFNKAKLNASWGFGLCDAPSVEFMQKFAAAVFGPVGLALGLKTVSVRAPGATGQPFLDLGLTRSVDDPDLLTAKLTETSPLGQWAKEFNNESS